MAPKPAVKIIVTTYRVVDDEDGTSKQTRIRTKTTWHRYDGKNNVGTSLTDWLADIIRDNLGVVDLNGGGVFYASDSPVDLDGIATDRYARFQNVSDADVDAAERLIMARQLDTWR